ncbi:MAG: hypothetical protein FWD97_07160 [Defluviitaleaceae bacterium]|nr:hypothetical protein [Defluviitaleaceae bacterium]
MFNKIEGLNFKKVFIVFFAALVGFGITYAIVMTASGYGADLAVWADRLTFARFRGRMFTDIQGTFRFFGYMFLVGFNALLALWVWVDSKKAGTRKTGLAVLTLFTGLVGWLVYMIKREERKLNVDNRG